MTIPDLILRFGQAASGLVLTWVLIGYYIRLDDSGLHERLHWLTLAGIVGSVMGAVISVGVDGCWWVYALFGEVLTGRGFSVRGLIGLTQVAQMLLRVGFAAVVGGEVLRMREQIRMREREV